MADAVILLQVLWTGLAAAAPMMLFAAAFSLVLHVVKVWNFAQAGFMGVALYGMYGAFNVLHWPMWAAILLGLALTWGGSVLMEILALDVLRRRKSPHLTFFILTLMLSQFLTYFFAFAFGTDPVSVTPETMSPVVMASGVAVSHWDLTAVTVAASLLLLLHGFMTRTSDGQFMLAVADNAELAGLYGISARRARVVAFTAAAVLITAGMYLSGTRGALTAHTPMPMMLFAVIATLLGGTGKVFRAAFAALVLALIQGLSIFVIPSQWQALLLYVFLFVTILFFPNGFRLHSWRVGLKPAPHAGGASAPASS